MLCLKYWKIEKLIILIKTKIEIYNLSFIILTIINIFSYNVISLTISLYNEDKKPILSFLNKERFKVNIYIQFAIYIVTIYI